MKILLALVAWASLAHAESPNEVEARKRYTDAQKLFDRARYADALAEFEASYALSGYPAIVHKIAMCHDQLGHVDQAIESYKRYLTLEPGTERRPGIEERIATLERSRAAPATEPPPEAKPAPAPAIAPVAVEARPEPRKRPVYKKWWLWTIVGVVAAGAAVGLGVGLTVKTSPTPGSFDDSLGRFGKGY